MFKLLLRIQKNGHLANKIVRCNLQTGRYLTNFNYDIVNYFDKILKDRQPNIYMSNKNSMNTDINSSVEEKLKGISNDFERISESTDKEHIKQLVDDLDIKCFSIVESLKPSYILQFLNLFYKLIEYKCTMLFFYDKSIPFLVEALEKRLLTNHEIVQVLYFISLKGKRNAHYITQVYPFLPDLNSLPLIEKCILAKAFCKSLVKLNLRETKIMGKVIEEDFKTLIQNPSLLEALCEAILLSELNEDLPLKYLNKTILNYEESLNFYSTTTLLGIYSKALIFEPKVIDKLVKNCFSKLTEDLRDNENTISIKEIDSFLWSIRNLSLILTADQKELFKKLLESRFHEYKLKENSRILVNTLLSLHMLNCSNSKIIKFCLLERLFLPAANDPLWMTRSNLSMLMTQLKLEFNYVLPAKFEHPINVNFKTTENIDELLKIADDLVKRGIINSASIECPINAIPIPGVSLFTTNRIYHIDVLDSNTCLRNTTVPHGMMNFKIRLISRLKYQSIFINESTFKDNPENTKSIITKKIQKSIGKYKNKQKKSILKNEEIV